MRAAAAQRDGMATNRTALATFLAVAAGLLAVAGCGPARPAASAPPPQAAPQVDATRALAFTREFVALGPRPAGSEGARRAADWLAAQCRALGYAPQVDEWNEDTPAGRLTFRNVQADLGNDPKAPLILLGSHYDTKLLDACPGFVGANDSGSSTGLLLELMRVLRGLEPSLRGTRVRFLFFDGEECRFRYGPADGLHGSRRAAARLADTGELPRCRAMILLDMVGDRDLRLDLPSDTDPDLLRRILRLAEAQDVSRHVSLAAGPILDDHVPFAQRGIPAVDLIDFSYGPGNAWWHTGEDTLDKLSPRSLEIVGNLALGLVLELAGDAP